MLLLLLLLYIYNYVYFVGQITIPSGIRVQCFQSSNCAPDTQDGNEIMTTEANLNHCCIKRSSDDPNTLAYSYDDYYEDYYDIDSNELLRDNPSERSFRLNDGECRPCDREFLLYS